MGKSRGRSVNWRWLDIARVIALIDGEHYPPVIKSALDVLKNQYDYEVAGAVFVGGVEKISEKGDFDDLGCPVVKETEPLTGIMTAIERFTPEMVIDLSDEPVIDYKKRFLYASHVLTKGIPYIGADFWFYPPVFQDVLEKPSLSVIGTGKRVGKTAIAGYICRCLDETGFNPGVIAMGRGGPQSPEMIAGREIELTPQFLLNLARSGKHAASDYLEDALTSRITAIGCRRCGGGLAGQPFVSNVAAGARLANELDVDFVVLEGSGSALPPVLADAYVLIIDAGQPIDYIGGYFGTYRVLLSDLIILSMCEPPLADRDKIEQLDKIIRETKPEARIVHTVFRPKPLHPIDGKKIFLATTAPASMKGKLIRHLEQTYGAEVVGASSSLSNRKALREEIDAARGTFTALLTELKAAAVDIVTSVGLDLGLDVVYMDNIPVTIGGDGELEDLVNWIGNKAETNFARRKEVGQRDGKKDGH
ncbi:MAG: 2,3-diphosphoglycerate synthetase [Candidatus Aquicultor secundus]|uniref:2,3-diphosphoglycerate synthetase n=1 Tax=Candidatus Aquicultor secundus TaxID=1973895 RepID=A0A2M7T9I5_9ACTN|nr:2,3-diphosphoglycerate synthetase [Candidatus Aquicultor secundus]NCO66861.1 2,3-diphosphoglycerate synthetase [Solirubrobacter sp.]PIU26222.1 MAG: 2,3-diphosphoglycerate synthetase [Candidatus Aquicultor secundus]PIW22161.1 MAG: 2,3-diphosphoglycerate synthetase [Candidatus Aquicultor secundus]PIX51561.1 MAG: 2,3-diphosphoglycerate synthetase [Candidatus Aquicultor secundus]PIZ41099.1 MAG: 2,3-diphosphoglycerate synthetase [Candidatus Aquicultor secundus]